MFILFGYKEFRKVKAEKNEWCLSCRNTRQAYVKSVTWFTLFFIPIFPYLFRYYKICTDCGYATPLHKKQYIQELKSSNILPPSPFDDNVEAVQESHTPYSITIVRKRQFYTGMVRYKCVVDGKEVAVIKNGKTFTFTPDGNAETMFVIIQGFGSEMRSRLINLKTIRKNTVFDLKASGQVLELTERNNA